MFKTHQSAIAEFGRANPDNFARVLKFVILTIQTSLASIPADMESLDNFESGRADESIDGILYGWKLQAIADINRDKESLFSFCEHIESTADSDIDKTAAMLEHFSARVGFGLAKSGFAIQCLYGNSGGRFAACLDSHNLARFGIPESKFRATRFKNAKTTKTRRKIVAEYIATCDKVSAESGRDSIAESLWNSWCEFVAAKSNGRRTGFDVSQLHLESLGLTKKEF